MKILGRQDMLLISALATVLVIVFSSSISRGLDYAREIERQSGLSLMPALVVLVGAFVFHQYRQNHQQQAKAEAAMLAKRDAEQRAEELERLVAFGQALGRSLDLESVRVAIGQHLTAIAGSDDMWVLVQEGSEWQALTGDTRGAEEVLKWGDLAEQLLGSSADRSVNLNDRWAGFPLLVGA
ncbi:MAG: hypothetical protein ABI983_00385, partial [Acidobacteriota bacterium]